MREFTETIQFLFPHVTRRKVKTRGENNNVSVLTMFDGINIKPLESISYKADPPLDIQLLIDLLPENGAHEQINNESVCCKLSSNYLSNGNPIVKTIQFNCDKTFSVTIADKQIDLKSIGIDNTFQCTKDGIGTVFKCVQKIRLCIGMTVNTNIICTRFHVLEQLNVNGETYRQLRSTLCSRVVKFNATSQTCRTCQHMTRTLKTCDSDKENRPKPKHGPEMPPSCSVTKAQLQQMIPDAPDHMIELLLSQFKNTGKHPKGRRWSKDVMNSSLQIFTRSPAVYKQIRDSQLLVLPSPSFLLTYKNKVKHNVGFQHEIFRYL